MTTSTDVRRRLPWTTALVWAVWPVALGLIALGARSVVNQPQQPDNTTNIIITAASVAASIAALTLVTSGAILVTKLARHPIGWLLWLGGVLLALAFGGVELAVALLAAGIPGAVWVVWLTELAWVPGSVMVALFVPLLFPTGTLPSPRWRPVAILGVLAVTAASVVTALSPFNLDNVPAGLENPLAVEGSARAALELVDTVSKLAGVICLPLVAASLVVRFRRSSGIERAQLKWFAAAAVPIGPAFAVGLLAGGPKEGPAVTITSIAFLVVFAGLALFPIAIGIAILRYRLYEIDRIISRTISYGLITAVLVLVFGAAILLLQGLLAQFTAGNTLAVAVSTLVVATLFQPLRRRVQTGVDRRFNRTRYDAERIEASFGARLRGEMDSATLRADLADTVAASVRPTSVGVWVRSAK